MNIKCLYALLIFLTLVLFNGAAQSEEKYLFDWNDGDGQNLTGWTWFDDISYGNPGWILSNNEKFGQTDSFLWGNGPRSVNKGDYGKDNTALIDLNDRAPSTLNGGSLLIKETPESTDHHSSWWLWYDGKPLIERNITNNDTDRMSFYLKTSGMEPLIEDEGKDSILTNFHIGTYLCWNTDNPAYGSGDGCPYEGPGNQHYYHYLSIDSGAWLHVLLDQHPQHHRGIGETENNPVSGQGKNYFAQLNQFYAEIRTKQAGFTSYNIDELKFYSTKDTVEPNQNDISISSLWVGYWPETGFWQLGFFDTSFDSYNDNTLSTFEVRWSTQPITNANYQNATLIEAMLYSGESFVGSSYAGKIRKPNAWKQQVRTKFALPSEVLKSAEKIYFAVKDVSRSGEHIGLKWPWNKGDGHDAPSDFVKLIDYSLLNLKKALAKPPSSFKGSKLESIN